jgi:hypothetical protein
VETHSAIELLNQIAAVRMDDANDLSKKGDLDPHFGSAVHLKRVILSGSLKAAFAARRASADKTVNALSAIVSVAEVWSPQSLPFIHAVFSETHTPTFRNRTSPTGAPQ